jgi:hypothetical protein
MHTEVTIRSFFIEQQGESPEGPESALVMSGGNTYYKEDNMKN